MRRRANKKEVVSPLHTIFQSHITLAHQVMNLDVLRADLDKAVRRGHAPAIREMLRDAPFCVPLLAAKALLAAVQDRQESSLRELLDQCLSSQPEVRPAIRQPFREALNRAIEQDNAPFVHLLMSSSCVDKDWIIQDAERSSPALLHAIGFEKVEAVKALLECGCDPNMQDAVSGSPLFAALSPLHTLGADLALVKALLPWCDAHLTNKHGTTALMIAAMGSSLDVVKVLLQVSEPSAKDQQGGTALEYALGEQMWESADEIAQWVPVDEMLHSLEIKTVPMERLPKARARLERAQIEASITQSPIPTDGSDSLEKRTPADKPSGSPRLPKRRL